MLCVFCARFRLGASEAWLFGGKGRLCYANEVTQRTPLGFRRKTGHRWANCMIRGLELAAA